MNDPALNNASSYSILQVFNRYLQYGGEEQSVERIREQLTERYTLNSLSIESREWVGRKAPGVVSQAGRVFYNPSAARRLQSQINKLNPDAILLHNLYPVGSPSLYRTALKNGVPVIQYIHNFRPFSVSGTLWANGELCEESLRGNYWREVRYGAWQDSIVKSAVFATALKFLHASGWLDAIEGWIAISAFMRDKFIEAGIAPEKVHLLSHCWEFQTPTERTFPDEGHYLYLGRLVSEKGVDVMLRAWQIIRQELREKTPQLCIGGKGPLGDSVVAAAERNPYISYLGFVGGEDKVALVAGCRAMIAPSTWWEPLGLVTYEAYDYKKPMFAAASGGLSETVQDGKTGYLHEPGDAQQLAQQVIDFEQKSARDRLEMGMQGREWLERNARASLWHDKFDNILTKILT